MVLTTQWSEIEQLQGRVAADTWRWFIDRYRPFVSMALRRLIWSSDRSAEAIDHFWGYLFEGDLLGRVGRQMRFRAFLISTLRNYAHDWMRRNPRVAAAPEDRRVDQGPFLPEDEEVALWARQLLYLAMQRLEAEQPTWASVVRSFYGLPRSPEAELAAPRRVTEVAAEMGCRANALHQVMYRARQRLRELLVIEVRQTVSGLRDLDSELEVLLSALGRVAPGVLAAPTQRS